MLEFVGFMWSSSICLALRCWIGVIELFRRMKDKTTGGEFVPRISLFVGNFAGALAPMCTV